MQRLVALTVAAVAFGVAVPAALGASPVHDTITASGSDSAPAGTICDFDYELDFDVTINRIRFFDDGGVLVRRIQVTEERLVHRNAETGFELIEFVHYTTHLDVATGLVAITGNHWHSRTSDGELVILRSGLEIFDRATGEVVRATPKVGLGFENVICPALGGAPA